jgi:hypothetical protein
MQTHFMGDSYLQRLRCFYEAHDDYDTARALARTRRLLDLYPPASGARVIDFATGTGIVALAFWR